MAAALTNQLRVLAGLTPSDTGDDELIKSWSKSLDVKVTGKWSKAVERINGTSCNGFHAIAYNDINATIYVLNNFCGIPELTDDNIELKNKLTDESFARNPNVWKIMSSLNKLVIDSNTESAINVPTIEEIRNNIAEHKTKKEEKKPNQSDIQNAIQDTDASVTKAVRQVFTNLINVIAKDSKQGKKFVNATANMTGVEILEALRTINETHSEFEDACANADIDILCDTIDWSPLFPDEKRRQYFLVKLEEAKKESLDKIQTHLNHLNSFTRVNEYLPGQVMTEIESYTSGLLKDLKQGKKKIEDLDLEKIGADVVGACTEDDMEKMGENINELLPVLQRSGLFDSLMKGGKI